MTGPQLSQCQWPGLEERYDLALKEAVAFILGRFEVRSIVAGGSIIRGSPGPSSDLDIYVIHTQPRRQRLQKFFNGVPAEIFVNPIHQILKYLDSEQREGRPITAHILTTGFVVLDQDDVLPELRQRAAASLSEPPNPEPARLTLMRYFAADRLDNALDIVNTKPLEAQMILGLAVHDMLSYFYLAGNHYIPRDKDLVSSLEGLNPVCAGLARQFFQAATLLERAAAAKALARHTLGVEGFFEWESGMEEV
jgi:predicted nucleotidyltransferase